MTYRKTGKLEYMVECPQCRREQAVIVCTRIEGREENRSGRLSKEMIEAQLQHKFYCLLCKGEN